MFAVECGSGIALRWIERSALDGKQNRAAIKYESLRGWWLNIGSVA
jgi:hypothetical protein